MALSELTDDLNIISALGDNPNSDNDLTSEEVKQKFDESGNLIKAFINEQIVTFVNQLEETLSSITSFTGEHDSLEGRSDADQHPISAITGLQDALTATIPVTRGGTGAGTAAAARTNLGLGPVATENIVPITKGGTGATSASAARSNLGLGSVAVENTLPVAKGGTGATTAAAALAALYGIPKTKQVTTTGTNLNDYTATGIYFFSGSVTPTNIPGGTNGWLVVLNATQSDTSTAYVKQIFLRAGTPGSNDFYIWARTKQSGGSWGSWCKLLMNTLVSGEYGTSLPAAGSPGRVFFKKVGS